MTVFSLENVSARNEKETESNQKERKENYGRLFVSLFTKEIIPTW